MKKTNKKGLTGLLIPLLVTVSILAMTGCGAGSGRTEPTTLGDGQNNAAVSTVNADNDSEDNTMTGSEGYKKALAFMVENYGLTVEELAGLDVENIISDYELDKEDYTAEEVRAIIEEQKDFYRLDPAADIYSLLGDISDIPASGNDLTADADIVKIAFYENPGSLQRKMLFDLEENMYFVDDIMPRDLTADQVSTLKSIAKNTDISTWKHCYESDNEAETTGSYAWKLVFLLSDGTECVYGGYTRDMTTMPESYSSVKDILAGIAEE